MHAHGTPPITPGREWVLLILGGIVTVLVVVAAITVLFRPQTAGNPGAGTRPVPTASPSPAPVTGPRADIAPGTPTPTACDQIYSPEMIAAFDDLVLNPQWTTEPGADVGDGAYDPRLVGVITSAEHLSCRWANPDGPSDSGVDTSVVWVTPEQTAAVTDRLTELGYDCFDELDGLRCGSETDFGDLLVGEAHFLRDGLWLATRYTNAGPSGYTRDMVATIWAER